MGRILFLFFQILSLFDLYQVNNTKVPVVYIIKSKKYKLMIYKFLFPLKPDSAGASLFLLILRISFGLLLMNHGIQKWSNFQELSTSFP